MKSFDRKRRGTGCDGFKCFLLPGWKRPARPNVCPSLRRSPDTYCQLSRFRRHRLTWSYAKRDANSLGLSRLKSVITKFVAIGLRDNSGCHSIPELFLSMPPPDADVVFVSHGRLELRICMCDVARDACDCCARTSPVVSNAILIGCEGDGALGALLAGWEYQIYVFP